MVGFRLPCPRHKNARFPWSDKDTFSKKAEIIHLQFIRIIQGKQFLATTESLRRYKNKKKHEDPEERRPPVETDGERVKAVGSTVLELLFFLSLHS